MNFFNLLKQMFISFIFETNEYYLSFIGNIETWQEKVISFIIDFLAFSIPLAILLSIFIIPFYFILKSFNKVIKTMRTNVYVEEEREKRFTRKKR